MYRNLSRGLALTVSLFLIGMTPFHLELTASYPGSEATLSEVPTEVWLQFSMVPDIEQTSFSISGPDGSIELGAMTQGEGDDAKVVRAEVSGPMPAGSYTVDWVGAPVDDHSVMGRFFFSIETAR